MEASTKERSSSSDSDISDGWNFVDVVDNLPQEVSDAESVEVLHEESFQGPGQEDMDTESTNVSATSRDGRPVYFENGGALDTTFFIATLIASILLLLPTMEFFTGPIITSYTQEKKLSSLSEELAACRIEKDGLRLKLVEVEEAYSSFKNSILNISTVHTDGSELGDIREATSELTSWEENDLKTEKYVPEQTVYSSINYVGDPVANTDYILNIINTFKHLPVSNESNNLLQSFKDDFDLLRLLSQNEANEQFVDKWEKKLSKFANNLKYDIDNMLSKLLRHVNRTASSVRTKYASKLCSYFSFRRQHFKAQVVSKLEKFCTVDTLNAECGQLHNQNEQSILFVDGNSDASDLKLLEQECLTDGMKSLESGENVEENILKPIIENKDNAETNVILKLNSHSEENGERITVIENDNDLKEYCGCNKEVKSLNDCDSKIMPIQDLEGVKNVGKGVDEYLERGKKKSFKSEKDDLKDKKKGKNVGKSASSRDERSKNAENYFEKDKHQEGKKSADGFKIKKYVGKEIGREKSFYKTDDEKKVHGKEKDFENEEGNYKYKNQKVSQRKENSDKHSKKNKFQTGDKGDSKKMKNYRYRNSQENTIKFELEGKKKLNSRNGQENVRKDYDLGNAKGKYRGKLNSSSGSWYLSLGKSRSGLRFESHRSDWLFDRARARQGWRRDSGMLRGKWLFDRAWVRRQCRMSPKSEWCRSQTTLHKDVLNSRTYSTYG